MSKRGHCLCGACRFELSGSHLWVGHCHCESCRRATASAFATWIGQENGYWTLTGAPLKTFESSPGQTRGFCGTCGTPLFYKSTKYPDETHFYAALLEDPNDVVLGGSYHSDEKLHWIEMDHRPADS